MKLGWAGIALVAIIGGCVGNQIGHQTVANECEKLGAFYMGQKVYTCNVRLRTGAS